MNLQQIPSSETTVRLIFKASERFRDAEMVNGVISVFDYEEVSTTCGWKKSYLVNCGDVLILSDNDKELKYEVVSTKRNDSSIVFEVRKAGDAK